MSYISSNETLLIVLPSRLGSALGGIVAFFFIIFGILGDTLIITAILSKKELRHNLINIFIVSLQLNDIFNIGFNQFLVGLSYTFMKWYGPYFLCEIFVYTSIICTGSLLWHHALISIHRYLVVVCNFNVTYYGISPKIYIIVSIIVARLIPVLVCIPAFISRQMTVYSPIALRCLLAPNVSGFQNLLIVIINMLIPCLIVFVCFAYIFARVHNVSKNVRHASLAKNSLTKFSSSITTTSVLRRELKITKMFATIFTVFLFGYLPYGVIRLVDKDNDLHPDFYVFLTVLFIVSISISPIVYGLMNKQINTQCVEILRKVFRCERDKNEFAFKNENSFLRNKYFLKRMSEQKCQVKVDVVNGTNGTKTCVVLNNKQEPRKLSTVDSSDSICSSSPPKNSLKENKINNDENCALIINQTNRKCSMQKNNSSESLSIKSVFLNDDGGVYKGPP